MTWDERQRLARQADDLLEMTEVFIEMAQRIIETVKADTSGVDVLELEHIWRTPARQGRHRRPQRPD